MGLKEYRAGSHFPGRLERTVGESEAAWPEPKRARDGAANVVFIVIDDMGFGQLGCYGSPIKTPNFDRLAKGGLLYTNMHTTALCSPSRSCILTGRNHHSNAMACITEGSTGFPGSNGLIPFENGFLSEILQGQGYNTYALGKWHLTPAEQVSAAGPYDRWPLGRGFERFYGFLGGDTSQYYPDLVHDNHQVEPPRTPEEGYHLTPDLVDKAIGFIADSKQVAPKKPFFLYFATGAMHAPHQVPKEWADRYKGQFDDGYEKYREKVLKRQIELGIFPKGTKLSRPDPDVERWDALSPDARRLFARMMEVFAGYLEHTDAQLGRLLDFLEANGDLDNTLIMVVSDNGASAEGGAAGSLNENKFFNNVPETIEENLKAIDELGGPKHYNHYMWGWAWAGNTPFRRWKRETYRGGTTDPFLVHWPKGIKAKGEIRTQYAHLIDMVPTVLDALGVQAPEQIRGVTQSPIEGYSLLSTFEQRDAPSLHRTQYFEMFGHRSLYHEGWRAVCPVPGPSFKEAGEGFGAMALTEEKLRALDAKGWELYHVAEDPSENVNLAEKHRDKLIEMIALWYVEAGKYNVLPLDSRGVARFAEPRPQLSENRERYTYLPGTAVISENATARLNNRPHSITAEIEVHNGAEGVLLSQGGNTGGYALYVKDHRVHYVHNYVGSELFHFESDVKLPEGRSEVRFEFEPTGAPDIAHGKGTPGRAQLYVNGRLSGELDLPVTMPLTMGLGEGLACGRDPGSGVTDDYETPFEFTGTLKQVVIDVSGELIEDLDAKSRAILAHQ